MEGFNSILIPHHSLITATLYDSVTIGLQNVHKHFVMMLTATLWYDTNRTGAVISISLEN